MSDNSKPKGRVTSPILKNTLEWGKLEIGEWFIFVYELAEYNEQSSRHPSICIKTNKYEWVTLDAEPGRTRSISYECQLGALVQRIQKPIWFPVG